MKAVSLTVLGSVLACGLLTACDRKKAPAEASSDNSWQTYASPAGFYTVEHPGSWNVAREDNIVNIMPEDETGAVTISAFHGDAPISNFAATWLRDSFEKEEATSDQKVLSLHGWTGVTQTFQSSADNRKWIAIVAQTGKVFVLITANDTPKSMEMRRETYERILHSLRIKSPNKALQRTQKGRAAEL